MTDEYEPRDWNFEKVKNFYQEEIKGQTLKRMEANKRAQIAQKVWK